MADKPVNALSPDLARNWQVGLRDDVLAELAGLPADRRPRRRAPASPRWSRGCAGAGRDGRPCGSTRSARPSAEAAAARASPGSDASPSFGRQLVAGDDPTDGPGGRCCPTPVDHVLLQADLTAIAPGPLEQELAHKLALVADVESRGGATVYRFAASSVRRAFDAGWSAAEVHDFVASTSRTPVPQSLTYLIDDVVPALRHPARRARRVVPAQRRRDRADRAGARARRRGAAAAPDRPDRGDLRRTPRHPAPPHPRARPGAGGRGRRRHRPGRPARRVPRAVTRVAARRPATGVRTVARTAAVVTAIRVGDRSTAARPVARHQRLQPDRRDRDAAPGGRGTSEQLLIGYVGNDGTVAERMVSPERVEGGRLTAYDERSDSSRTFAIHRITAVSRPVGGG